ncbi:unnamed protein product [Discosporangium mesarthrocarpum]
MFRPLPRAWRGSVQRVQLLARGKASRDLGHGLTSICNGTSPVGAVGAIHRHSVACTRTEGGWRHWGLALDGWSGWPAALVVIAATLGMGEHSENALCSAANPSDERTGGPLQDMGAVALSLVSVYNANSPIEDRHDIRESPMGDFFAAVYDGHGGWQAAEFARKRLAKVTQVGMLHSLAKTSEQIKSVMVQAFLRVEREYMYQVKAAFDLGFGSVARTGACALMALVHEDKLFVANAGDCRAVLGRRRAPRVWGGRGTGGVDIEAVELSNDHNAREKAEQEKLKRLHPFEDDIIRCKRATACYVKGRLQPTRSLGDAYLKYSEFNGQPGTHSSSGRYLPPPYTPPYITAEPEVTEHKIDPEADAFVVLASDGLWDYVSSEEAVKIVQAAAYEDMDPKGAADRLIRVSCGMMGSSGSAGCRGGRGADAKSFRVRSGVSLCSRVYLCAERWDCFVPGKGLLRCAGASNSAHLRGIVLLCDQIVLEWCGLCRERFREGSERIPA